jgi:hypothetical protein
MYMLGLRVGLPALAISALVSLATALPAAADVQVACTLEGSTSAAVNWAGSNGAADTYNFGPSGMVLVCAGGGTIGGMPHVGTAAVNPPPGGHFTNIICGTGTWTSNPVTGPTVVVGSDPVLNAQLSSMNWAYTITFIAFQGLLIFSNGDPGGYVNLAPWNSVTHPGAPFYFPGDPLGTAPPPATGKCTAGFDVHGVVTRGARG